MLDTENLARRGFQHGGGQAPSTGKQGGGVWFPLRVLAHMNFLKHLLTDWLGVSTVELCGRKERDLGGGGTLRYVWAQKCVCVWGERSPSASPPSLESLGGRAPPCLPCYYAYGVVVLTLGTFSSGPWFYRRERLGVAIVNSYIMELWRSSCLKSHFIVSLSQGQTNLGLHWRKLGVSRAVAQKRGAARTHRFKNAIWKVQ